MAHQEYLLKAGYIYLPVKPTIISTVLGSSVSVGIYDRCRKIGGMNHFLFPVAHNKNKTTASYGNVAIITLIRMMQENGSRIVDMEAQIFGGAHNFKVSRRNVGNENITLAHRLLRKKGIRVVSQDVGGNLGRKVVFNTTTCEIVTLKVERLRDSDWFPYTDTGR